MAWISAGRPCGEFFAEVDHHQPVDQIHHELHVVLDQQDAHPLVAQPAQQLGERLFFRVSQPGRRLVHQHQHRIGAQRARDLDDALLAQRQAPGRFVQVIAQADAIELARGFGQQPALLGALGVQHRGDRSARAAQVRADRDVLDHRHRAHQVHVLESPAHPAARDLALRSPLDAFALEA